MAARRPTRPDVARYGAAGGLLTTPADYAKFLIEVIDPKPSGPFRLSKAGVKEMLRPQIKVSDGEGYSILWALGWRVVHTVKGNLIGHGGENPGFQCMAESLLKTKLDL